MRAELLGAAAGLMLAIAGLHMLSAVFAGGPSTGFAGFAPAVLALAVAAGLWRGWRWLAWLAMPGAIVALGAVLGRVGYSGGPDGVLYLLAGLYAIFVVVTFAALWRGRRARAPGRSEPLEIRQ